MDINKSMMPRLTHACKTGFVWKREREELYGQIISQFRFQRIAASHQYD